MTNSPQYIDQVAKLSAQIQCRLCGAQTRASRFTGYRMCKSCGFVQADVTPPDAELACFYTESYEVDRDNYVQSVSRRADREVTWLETFVSPGRMLEVGCSWGKFLDIARRRGWSVSGVELSEGSSAWAREELQLDIFTGKLEDSPFAGSHAFDLVTSWHVIEHAPDPLSFLKACRSCLRPGGYLVLKTPNVVSLAARLNGPAWSWADPVAHLVLFSPETLRLALGKSGFQWKHMLTRRGDAHHPGLEVARGTAIRLGMHGSVKKKFKVGYVDGDKTDARARGISLLNGLNRGLDIGLFWLWPVEALLNWANMGPEIQIVSVAV